MNVERRWNDGEQVEITRKDLAQHGLLNKNLHDENPATTCLNYDNKRHNAVFNL